MANTLETFTDTNNPRLSVPSSSEAPTQGSEKDGNRAEGAENLWVWTGCHWNMKICTHKARSLSSDNRILEFEDQLAKINFDVVGISEV